MKMNLVVRTLIFGALIVILTACNDILNVDNPSSLTDEDLDDAAQIDVLANSAEGKVLEAYPLVVLAGGLVGDGIMATGTQTEFIRLDQGFLEIESQGRDFAIDESYNALSEARWTANFAVERIKELIEDQNDIRIARARLFEGFSLILLADNWEEVTLDGNAPISPWETYELAIDKFEESLSIASASNNDLEVPLQGLLARTNHALAVETGDVSYLDQAATFAEEALSGDERFLLEGIYQNPSQPNVIFDSMNRGQLVVATGNKFINIDDIYSDQEEPRIGSVDSEEMSPAGDSIFLQQKYPSLNENIPIVKWQEMNLILAEKELTIENNIDNALEYLNRNRNEVGLPDLETNDINEAWNYLIYERRAEFWLEGRIWFDMRRFDLPFDRWSDASQNEGIDRKFPIPVTERNSNDNL